MKKILISLKIGALLLMMASCLNSADDMTPIQETTVPADGFSIPAAFNFTTSKTIEVNLSAPEYL